MLRQRDLSQSQAAVWSNQLHPAPDPPAEWIPVRPEPGPAPPPEEPAALRPRGEPLTPLMPFTGADGSGWIAYIEGVPPESLGLFGTRAVMPGRRLRFDTGDRSFVTGQVPAGSPFLPVERLAALLARAEPFPPPPGLALEPGRRPLVQRILERVRTEARRLRRRGARQLAAWEPVLALAADRIHHALAVVAVGARRAFR